MNSISSDIKMGIQYSAQNYMIYRLLCDQSSNALRTIVCSLDTIVSRGLLGIIA